MYKEYLRSLLNGEFKLECRRIELRVADGDMPPVFVGPGTVTADRSGPFRFELHNQIDSVLPSAWKTKPGEVLDEKHFAELRATTYDGVTWAGSGTRPSSPTFGGSSRRIVRGGVAQLTTRDERTPFFDEPTICYFDDIPDLRFRQATESETKVSDGRRETRTAYDHETLDVLGSLVRISRTEDPSVVEVRVAGATRLPPLLADRWIAAAMQFVSARHSPPRLVVRTLPTAQEIVLRGTSEREGDSNLPPPILNPWVAPGAFWSLFTRYLEFSATHEVQEATLLTNLVGQVIVASNASHDAFALSLAVAAEGLAREIDPDVGIRPATTEELESLRVHVAGWSGDAEVRTRAGGLLEMLRSVPSSKLVPALQRDGWLEPRHVEAWNSVRHTMAHGGLLPDPRSQKQYDLTSALVGLFYRLAFRIICYLGPATDYLQRNRPTIAWHKDEPPQPPS